MAALIQHRRGTAAQWAAANPVLFAGEIGYDTTSKVIKIGDGTTAWNALSSYLLADVQAALNAQSAANMAALASQNAVVDTKVAAGLATVPTLTAQALAQNSTVANAAAVAVNAELATAGLLRGFSHISNDTGYAYAVTDVDGKIAFGVTSDGKFVADLQYGNLSIPGTALAQSALDAASVEAQKDLGFSDLPAYSGYSYAITDEAGKVALGITPSGGVDIPANLLSASDPFDIFIAAGQSNMAGRGRPWTPEEFQMDPRVWEYPSIGSGVTQTLQIAQQVMRFHDYAGDPLGMGTHGISPAWIFGQHYARNVAARNRRVLIIPAAHGGTAFTTSSVQPPPSGYQSPNPGGGTWRPAGDGAGGINLWQRMIDDTKAALAASPEGSVIRGLLWLQGEGSSGQAQYETDFDAFVTQTRTALNLPNLPVIVGQMVPEGNVGSRIDINKAHVDTPRRLQRTAFIYGPTNAHKDDGPTHYAMLGVRRLGSLFLEGWRRALVNRLETATVDQIKLAPSNLTAIRHGNTVTAEWEWPMCRVTGYTIEWRADAGAWSATGVVQPAGPLDCKAVISNVTGTVVEVRVLTTNEHGNSPYTTTAAIGD